jgi:hypothetical protein
MVIADREGFSCTNERVRQFCSGELWHMPTHPFQPPPRSAWQVFWAARERFGDLACIDLLFYEQ